MDRKKNQAENDNPVAPGIDPDDSFGQNASDEEKKKGEYTQVSRLKYDEYDPSEKTD